MVQTGGLSRPFVRLVSPKVELYEDAGVNSPCALKKLDDCTISVYQPAGIGS